MMKLPAFTIMELVMVMALSAIVIGFAYSAWRLVERSMGRYGAESDVLLESVDFQTLIRRDFEKASRVSLDGGRLFLEYGGFRIIYEFGESQTLRNVYLSGETLSSNIPVKVDGLECGFQGGFAGQGLVDACDLNYRILDKTTRSHLRKEYSADDLMRHSDYGH